MALAPRPRRHWASPTPSRPQRSVWTLQFAVSHMVRVKRGALPQAVLTPGLCCALGAGSVRHLIFGASGDLARRKLLPGLLGYYQAGLMAEFRIVGISITQADERMSGCYAQARSPSSHQR